MRSTRTVVRAVLVTAALCGGWALLRTPASPAPTDRGASGALLGDARSTIESLEYEWSPSGAEIQAPNRAQNLRTYLGPEGMRVRARTGEDGEDLVHLRLAAIARDDARQLAGARTVTHRGERAELDHAGAREWFVNTPSGVEHGFTIDARPRGSGLLRLELAVARASASLSGSSVRLTSAAGRSLEYGGLHVEDATGRAIAASLEVPDPARIVLAIDDADARYPLTVDPILNSAGLELSAPAGSTQFGLTVSGAGDFNGDGHADALVASPFWDGGQNDEGAVFLYLGGAGGFSAPPARIESNQASARLGWGWSGDLGAGGASRAGDVNGDGFDDVILGGENYPSAPTNRGAFFIFHGGAAPLPNSSVLDADTVVLGTSSTSHLGGVVASAGDVNGDGFGDVIVVDTTAPGGGVANVTRIFHGSAAGIPSGGPASAATTLTTTLTGLGASSFATAASGIGDVNGDGYGDVMLGAPTVNVVAAQMEGVVYTFHGGPSGIPSGNQSSAISTITGALPSEALGRSIDAAGDVNGDGYADVVVGASGYSDGPSLGGAALVFHGSATGLGSGPSTAADGILEGTQVSAQLGRSVAGLGDVNGDGYADIAAGAPFYDTPGADAGATVVALGGPSGIGDLTQSSAYAVLISAQPGARHGTSVAGVGDIRADGFSDLIVGVPLFNGAQTDSGQVVFYEGGATGFRSGGPTSAAAAIEHLGEDTFARFGTVVASAGDVNSDGYDDLIVGAPYFDLGEMDEGAAFVFHGGPNGITATSPTQANRTLESNLSFSEFGRAVSSADLNGDGYSDVIVGSFGAAYVFNGSASGVVGTSPATATTVLTSESGFFFGWSAASAGDVNADGFPDLMVGSADYQTSPFDFGAVFIYHGRATSIPSGNTSVAATRLEADAPQSGTFAASVASAGDFNGDGYGDVVVGEPGFGSGTAFLATGGPAGVASGSILSRTQIFSTSGFGWEIGKSVASAGDLNGDGFGDLVVGAPSYTGTQSFEGAAFFVYGEASVDSEYQVDSLSPHFAPGFAFAALGNRVAPVGDMDLDGYGDVVVNATGYENGNAGEAAAFVVRGQAAPILIDALNPSQPALEGNADFVGFGEAVASAGDVDGDGFPDLAVSSRTSPAFSDGSVYVFRSSGPHAGRRQQLRAVRSSLTTRSIEPWGSSHDPNGFTVRLSASHPEGGSLLKLEAQACPKGVPFGHASCSVEVSPAWSSYLATTGALPLSVVFDGLPAPELWRWRARLIYAPLSLLEPGILAPPSPRHGPWFAPAAGSTDAFVRTVFPDTDGDGITDNLDNCPTIANTNQQNTDLLFVNGDTNGDACDSDDDADADLDAADNCPLTPNPSQQNADGDAFGDYCDVCPASASGDPDSDGVCNPLDNCPSVANPTQSNIDPDPLGDACDSDRDGDGVADLTDNCLAVPNASQQDTDGDGFGNACDAAPTEEGDTAQFGQAFFEPRFRFFLDPAAPWVDPDTVGTVSSPTTNGTCKMYGVENANADIDFVWAAPLNPQATNRIGCCAWEAECRDGNAQVIQCTSLEFPPQPPNVIINGSQAFGVEMFSRSPAFEAEVFTDGDAFPDQCDNCRYVANNSQADADHDGIGDACECGDPQPNGLSDSIDVQVVREALTKSVSPVNPAKCNAIGPVSAADSDGNGLRDDCSVVDLALIRRTAAGSPPSPGAVCVPALPAP